MKATFSIPIQLLILILSLIFCIILSSLLGTLAIYTFSSDPTTIDLNEPKVYLLFGFLSQLVGFIGGFFLFLLVTKQRLKDVVSIAAPQLKLIGLVVGILLLSMPIINGLIYLNSILVELIPNNNFVLQEKEILANQYNLLSANSFLMMVSKLFVIAFLPAVGEELVFRGVLLKKIQESSNNEHYGVIVSAALFAVVHQQPSNLLPMIFLGVVLGYIYTRTNNIFYSMLFHFLFNSMTVMSVYFFPELLTQ